MPNGISDEVVSRPVKPPARPVSMRPPPTPFGDDLSTAATVPAGTMPNGEAGISFAETEGDAYVALKAPSVILGEAAETTEAHEEVGPEASEAAEASVVEA